MNDFTNRVFQIIKDSFDPLSVDMIMGKDDVFSILIPFGRGKGAEDIAVGEQTLLITKKRELYKDKRGRTRPFVYRVIRIS